MSRAEEFHKLTKPEQDLFKKFYSLESLLTLKAAISQNDLKFQAKAQQLNTYDILALAGIEYQTKGMRVLLKKYSNNRAHLLAEYIKTSNLYTILGCVEHKISGQGLSKKSEPGIKVQFSTNKANLQMSLKDNPLVMNIGLTAVVNEFIGGLDWKFALHSQKYTEYQAAIAWVKNEYRLVAKHIGKEMFLGTFELSYYLKINPLTTLASFVRTTWESKITEIQLGAQHMYNDHTMLKGKVDSNGKCAFLVKRELNPNTSFVFSAEIDTKDATSSKVNHSLGLSLIWNFPENKKIISND
ncbi:hypothetical protein SteCoe_1707 [Stentor coeruleus]|uniref:Uncharacterized protein n=1 Tax=Stentor coeruleus TaxID=5963 RepID=A0A1R2D177_9CILI|nr:hypothetical protein SteCoe_1707 [Stentor coeruleus]